MSVKENILRFWGDRLDAVPELEERARGDGPVTEYLSRLDAVLTAALGKLCEHEIIIRHFAVTKWKFTLAAEPKYHRFVMRFGNKPSATMQENLESHGYHWSGKNKQWEKTAPPCPQTASLQDPVLQMAWMMERVGPEISYYEEITTLFMVEPSGVPVS